MIIMRPALLKDLGGLLLLSQCTGGGLTTLPHDEKTLATRINRSKKTWTQQLTLAEQGYLFVMEDTCSSSIVGVSAIEVAVGLNEPWYSFRVTKEVHASKALDVYKTLSTLVLSNDHTGCSELCTLFLSPEYRKGALGRLLSKSRLMFIAMNRHLFPEKIIAELRGFRNNEHLSPFWEKVGKHFFSMEFDVVDFLSGTGQKAFIAELMPKHPLYIDLLPHSAQSAIGEVHPQTLPARKMLEREGLRYNHYVDIFDAGPTLEAYIDEVKTIKQSELVSWITDNTLEIYEASGQLDEPYVRDDSLKLCLIANEQNDMTNYKVTVCYLRQYLGYIGLHEKVAQALGISPFEQVRMMVLND